MQYLNNNKSRKPKRVLCVDLFEVSTLYFLFRSIKATNDNADVLPKSHA